MKKNAVKYLIFALGTALIVFLDRITKIWAVRNLMDKPAIELWPGVFELQYLENNGMAFGLLQNGQVFFYIVTAVILCVMLYFLFRTPLKKRYAPMLIVLVMMTGGAVGNLIDRISTKYVVDFLSFTMINFPIFNVADCFVTVSAISLFVLLIFVYKDEEFTEVYGFGKKAAAEKAENTQEKTADSPEPAAEEAPSGKEEEEDA